MRVERVTFTYVGERTPVLQECSITIKPGSVHLVVGRNGSGKTTLCKLLAGLMHEHDGSLSGHVGWLECEEGADSSIHGTGEGEEWKASKRSSLCLPPELSPIIGYIGGDAAQQFVIGVVEDELAFGPENMGVDAEEIERRIDVQLTAVSMELYRQAKVERLSGGQQQRIAAASVWTMAPDVLIIDDAWSHLDAEGRGQFAASLYKWMYPNGERSATRTLWMTVPRIDTEDLQYPIWQQAACWELEDGKLQPYKSVAPVNRAHMATVSISEEEAASSRTKEEQTMPVHVVLDSVSARYSHGPEALRSVTAEVRGGQGILLNGVNGAGKSTLFRVLTGALRGYRGSVLFNNCELRMMKAEQLARYVGYAPQQAYASFITDQVWKECMVVRDSLYNSGIILDQTLSAEEWCRNQLLKLDMLHDAARHPHDCSLSAQRKLSLFIATAHAPAFILLDEPTAGLDLQAALDVMSWCDQARARGAAVVVATHDKIWTEAAQEYSDWLNWKMHEGILRM
nr:ABC transporter ATP-binding protein [Paenibacillus sp. ACRRX]